MTTPAVRRGLDHQGEVHAGATHRRRSRSSSERSRGTTSMRRTQPQRQRPVEHVRASCQQVLGVDEAEHSSSRGADDGQAAVAALEHDGLGLGRGGGRGIRHDLVAGHHHGR